MAVVEYKDKRQKMNKLLKEISKIGVVPVVVLDDADKAVSVARALQRGGINCAEVTFRTAAAEESIRNIAKECPDMLLGAGTVLTIDQAKRAINAGAKFIVTPGYNPHVVNYCVSNDIPIVPGCMDTNAIEMALEAGIDTVKFFPAEAAGGLKMMKALAGPYTNLHFIPTGGINKDNLCDYLSFNKIIACGGSWMVKGDLINNGRFDEIEKITADAINQMLSFKVVHVGMNNDDEEEAKAQVKRFNELFGFIENEKTSSIFVSNEIEVCKRRFPGANGHLAIGTINVERAVYYLEKKGVEFDIETAKFKDNRLSSIYLKESVGGFAIHLVETHN